MNGPAAAVDGEPVPRARTDVASVTLGGETVIHCRGHVHVLDPVATLVWQCCDGEASVAEIAAELAEVFGTSPGTVRRDVGAAVEELTALGLLVDGDGDGDTDPGNEAGVELLTDPPGSCASCAERTWAIRRTYRTGSRVVAVGTNDERADRAISDALGACRVPAPPRALTEPPFFAVELHDRASEDGGPQLLDLLHRGDTVVARSRRPDRIVRALVASVASFGDLGALGLAAVNGLVVARGDRAMIVPYPRDPVRFRHALAGHGVLVGDLPVALVDASTGDVVVGAPGLSVDRAAIDALARDGSNDPSEREPEPLPWGRYHVIAMGVPEPASPSVALLTFGPEVGDHHDHEATVAALLALLDSVPVAGAVEPDAIAALLAPG